MSSPVLPPRLTRLLTTFEKDTKEAKIGNKRLLPFPLFIITPPSPFSPPPTGTNPC